MDTIERELRTAMDEGSAHLQVPLGAAERAWAVAQERAMDRATPPPRRPVRRAWRARFAPPSRRSLAFGSVGLVIALVAGIIALGGDNHTTNDLAVRPASAPRSAAGSADGRTYGKDSPIKKSAGVPAPSGAIATGGTSLAPSGTKSLIGKGAAASDFQIGTGRVPLNNQPDPGNDGAEATRVVKTGSLSLTVKKGAVATTITNLTKLTSRLGGYVSQSETATEGGSPTGSLTLRIPVDSFETAVSSAAALGHETALSTNADDVTGKFVDLGARLSALKHTRQTYLTILGTARTIGQVLSVQQRVNDIQQHINSLQGQLKVLRNQSRDGTLTVDVREAGSPSAAPQKPQHRSGFSKAWHNSTHRFNRGVQAIIGALGPLLLALIILAVLFVIVRLGLRLGRNRGTNSDDAAVTGGSASV